MVLVYLVSCSWAFTSRRPSAKCKHILALKPNLYHAGVETWKIVNFFDIVYHRKYMMVVPKVILIFYPYFSPHLSLSFSISHFSLISASLPHSLLALSISVSLSFLTLSFGWSLVFFFFFGEPNSPHSQIGMELRSVWTVRSLQRVKLKTNQWWFVGVWR